MVARDPTLARIELAYLGFNMAETATWVAILVYGYSLGGPGGAALVATVQLIPAGLIAPFAAYAGDRFSRSRVLVAGYLLQALTFGATATALYAGTAPAIVVSMATLAAIAVTFTRPVQGAILPSITHAPGDLTAANAVSGLAENLGIFVGPLVAGLLLARSSPGDVFAVFAGVAVVGSALVLRLPAIDMPHSAATAVGPRAFLAASFGGFGLLRANRPVLLVIAILASLTVLIGGLELLFVATAVDLLRLGSAWAGFLYAGFGIGGIVGAAAAVALVGRRRLTPSLAGAAALFGVPVAIIGIAPSPLTALILFAVSGAGYGIAGIAGLSLVQRIAPETILARVFGVLEGMTMFAYAIGTVVAEVVIATLGIGPSLIVMGLSLPAAIGVAWIPLARIDRHARAVDREALRLLRVHPIFAPLSAPSMERILAELEWLEIPAGQVVIREGDIGDRFYVLAEGRVEVTARGIRLSERGAGDHFGEIALLRDIPRTATVTAMTTLRLIVVERDRFLEAVTGHPRSRAHADAVARDQLAVGHAG